MSVEFRPKGLETWIYVLDENSIPVLAHTASKLKSLVSGVKEWSLHDVSEVIRQDPIMTVYLIRETQRVFRQRAQGTLTDIGHCVSLLGEDRVRALVSQFQPMKGDPADANEVAYQSAIVQSFHAAEQLLAWHQVRKQAAVDKHYLAAQLMGVPTWCLWYSARREMHMIDLLEKQERVPRDQAERAVLGCTTQEIVQALAARWYFPEVILNALDSAHLPSPWFLARVARDGYCDKEPKIPNKDERGQIVKTPSFIVALAHWLAHESAIDWYSRQTRRVLGVLASYLEVDIHSARMVAQKAALNVSRRFEFPAVQMPASRLLLPPQPELRRRLSKARLQESVGALAQGKSVGDILSARNQRAQVGQSATAVGPDEASEVAGFVSEATYQEFQQHLELLLSQKNEFATQDVLRSSVDTLFSVTGLSRVVLFRVDSTSSVLNGSYALGCEDRPEISKTMITLSPPNIFTHLIKKPQGLWMHPGRNADISAQVPGAFKELVQSGQFFAVSLFNHQGPVAVLYADHGAPQRAVLSEAEFKITQTLANAISNCLIRMG